ncbi:MAG: hypothetical protein CM15mP129_00980 [Chloroflexota bacterium]|nr:MAG: hypothetical protein CM15mP129_00980 [Chloroflexota bacterium]
MVAGHSLGEFSALVINKCISYEDGLQLVKLRANAMQRACELIPGTMAAILGISFKKLKEFVTRLKKSLFLQIIIVLDN